MQNKENQELNKTVLLVITMASNFLNPLMGAAVNVALPKIASDFSLNAIQLSWITMSYLLASAMFMLPFGKIADIVGRKKIFLYGTIIFMFASLLCAVSSSGTALILARWLQGLGGAMIYSTTMAIVISAFPPNERAKVIGLNVGAIYVGLAAAPVLGGILTEALGWRSLFFINASFSFLIVLAIFKIKAEWIEAKNEKFDWVGTLIYMPSIAALMFGFSKLPDPIAIVCTATGAAGLIAFIYQERKTPFPVLNMRLFQENKVFASSNLAAFINYAATFAVGFILSLYLQFTKHLSPKEAGLLLITQPIIMAIVSILSGKISNKITAKTLATVGMCISIIGIFMLTFLQKDSSQGFIILVLFILGFGFGLFSSPITNMVMSSVDKKYFGIASATLSTMRTTGMMFSMAIASLSIHLFMGEQKINDANIDRFMYSSKIVFFVFTALCILGTISILLSKNELEENQ